MVKKKICDGECGLEFEPKKLKKIIKAGKRVYLCKECYELNRNNHRAETIKQAGIEEDIKKYDNQIEELDKQLREKFKPEKKTKGIKEKKVKIKRDKTFTALALSKEEKQILFRKYIREGMTYNEADSLVRQRNEEAKELGRELRANKNLTPEQVNQRFKDKFNMMCLE